MQRILIVDNDSVFVHGMEIALDNKEREIYTAYGVKEALRILKEEDKRPDLICSDYQMYDGTVIDLMRYIKEYGMGCPVIVISGHDEEHYREKIENAGAAFSMIRVYLNSKK